MANTHRQIARTVAGIELSTIKEMAMRGSKVPDALLKTGFAYVSLDKLQKARTILKKVITNYPFTPAGAKAESMLKKIGTP